MNAIGLLTSEEERIANAKKNSSGLSQDSPTSSTNVTPKSELANMLAASPNFISASPGAANLSMNSMSDLGLGSSSGASLGMPESNAMTAESLMSGLLIQVPSSLRQKFESQMRELKSGNSSPIRENGIGREEGLDDSTTKADQTSGSSSSDEADNRTSHRNDESSLVLNGIKREYETDDEADESNESSALPLKKQRIMQINKAQLLNDDNVIFELPTPMPIPSVLNTQYICESASRLLFLSIHWMTKIPQLNLKYEKFHGN